MAGTHRRAWTWSSSLRAGFCAAGTGWSGSWAVAEAERQLRECSRNPPGRVRRKVGEFYAIPGTGMPRSEIGDWLVVPADHLSVAVTPADG